MAFLDALHVEAHGRDGAIAKYQHQAWGLARGRGRRGSSWLRSAGETDTVETGPAAGATRTTVDVLDGKLAALDGRQSFHRRRSALQAHFRNGKGLTARTRSNDVLPAFCSPIMVMSISVALHPCQQWSKGPSVGSCFSVLVAWREMCSWGGSKWRMPSGPRWRESKGKLMSSEGKQSTHQNRRRSQS